MLKVAKKCLKGRDMTNRVFFLKKYPPSLDFPFPDVSGAFANWYCEYNVRLYLCKWEGEIKCVGGETGRDVTPVGHSCPACMSHRLLLNHRHHSSHRHHRVRVGLHCPSFLVWSPSIYCHQCRTIFKAVYWTKVFQVIMISREQQERWMTDGKLTRIILLLLKLACTASVQFNAIQCNFRIFFLFIEH